MEDNFFPISARVRRAVFSVWGGKCAYCEGPAEHVDHIHPKADGGKDSITNYAPACARCNLKKSNMLISTPYIGIVEAQARRKAPKIMSILDGDHGAKSATKRSIGPQRSVINLNLPMAAIRWTSHQDPSPIPWITEGGEMEYPDVGTVRCDDLPEIVSAFRSGVPEWRLRNTTVPLVFGAPSEGFSVITMDLRLVTACRIASDLECRSFSFHGSLPDRAALCTPIGA